MRLRSLALLALLGGTSLISMSALAAPCDFTLNAGALDSGTLLEGTLTTPLPASGQLPAIASGLLIRGGKLSTGNVTQATATGGTLSGKACQGAKLTGADIAGVEVSGKITIVRADGTKEERILASPATISLTSASVDDATVSNPSAVLEGKAGPAPNVADKNAPLAGDWFKFKATVLDARIQKAPGEDKSVGLVIPPNTCFRVAAEFEETEGTKKTRYARGTFSKAPQWWWPPSWLTPPYDCDTLEADEPFKSQCATIADTRKRLTCEEAARDRAVEIPTETLVDTGDRYRFGFTYGVMVAPFKYYRGSKTFDAGAQVGPYLGYRVWDRQGSSTVLALGVGAISARVKTGTGDTATEETKNGLSWAVGVLTEFKNSFNVGLLWGMDMFSAADAVPNQGAHWLSVSFGYKLSP